MRSGLSTILSERARLFLLSLVMAVVLWLYVGTTTRPSGDSSSTASLRLNNVEVAFTGLSDDRRASANPPQVEIELRWPAPAVLSVRASDVRAIADVTGLDPGAHPVTLRIQVPAGAGVTTVRATPPSVIVTVIGQ
jgi:YbbR domain-containing protein